MVFAIVHFTVGFVLVLALLSLVPITQYRLTGAYLGGVFALVPDAHNLVGGALGRRIRTLHDSGQADLFFYHYTLDSGLYRAYNMELTFFSLAVLGLLFLVYDWRFGVGRSPPRRSGDREWSDDLRESD